MAVDYFAPVLKRILAVAADVQELAATMTDLVKRVDTDSADLDQFLADLELAHKAHMKLYESGVAVSANINVLNAELHRLQIGLPIIADKMGDAGSVMLAIREITNQDYINLALALHRLDMDLYYQLFKELSTYSDWAIKGPVMKTALDMVCNVNHVGKETHNPKETIQCS